MTLHGVNVAIDFLTWWERRIQRKDWLAGTAVVLLLISTGLMLLAHQAFGQTDMGTLLWSIFLGFWTYVLGIVGLFIYSITWFLDWRRVNAN